MKNERLTVRISQEQKELLNALGGGKPSAGLDDIFGRLEWIKQTLPKLTAEEKNAVCSALVSSMWTPAMTGAALAANLADFAEYEKSSADQFDVDYKKLAEKLAKFDRLAVFAIYFAKDAILGAGFKDLEKYW